MPTYEYECLSCQHRFDTFQSITDEPLTVCPECGKKVRRLIHGGMGIIFKGSGFYSTDNRSGGHNGSGKTSGDSGPASEKPASSTASTVDKASSSTPASKSEPAKTKS